jgi:plasmid maintenance system antidote protein VapI
MQKQLDEIKKEVVDRIRIVFLRDFDGNNRKFARAVGCDEKTIRYLFDHNQGMTLNLLLKISRAIQISPSELLKGLEFKKED